MVAVGLLHDLDPLDGDSVLLSFVLCLVDGQLGNLLQAEDTEAPVNEEFKLLLDLVPALLEDFLAHGAGVVGDLRLKLHSVLVDTLNRLVVEVNGEIVAVKLEGFAHGAGSSRRLLGEQVRGRCC